MAEPLAVAVLAAGQGTRMKSRLPKMLHEAAGRPLLEHVLRAVAPLQPARTLVVVGHGAKQIKARFRDHDVTFVTQTEQLGTGHALLQTEPELQGFDGQVMVLNGDMPLLRTDSLMAMLERQKSSGAAMTLLSCEVEDPAGLGRVVRQQDGSVAKIVEEKDASPGERQIREINPGAYLFGSDVFARSRELSNENASGEYYITDLVDIYIRSGCSVQAVLTHDELRDLVGVNDRKQLAMADRILRDRVRRRWLESGVTMVSPEQVFIDDTVMLARDVILHPGVVLRGDTNIGEGATVGPYCVLTDCRVEAGAEVPPHTVERGTTLR